MENITRSDEMAYDEEAIAIDLQQVRREVENLILQFEQIADVVEKIDYDGKPINVREFFQRAISRYQLEREESINLQAFKKPVLPEVDLSGMKILTVEDNEDISTLLTIILEAAGARVSRASSAKSALQLLEERSFTIIISDIGMPEMNGLEFLHRLRDLGDLTPAIALSAYATPKDEQSARDVGFSLFLAKPVHPGNLMIGIAQVVANARLS
jgi:CheY-like chemotaxis protein